VRLDIRRIGAIKDGETSTGNRVRVKVVKNKVAPPFRQAEFDILFGEGTSREGLLLDLGVDNRVIEKSGAWFSYGEERLGQGRENTRAFLKDNPDITAAIERDVKRALGMLKEGDAGAAATAAGIPVGDGATALPATGMHAEGNGTKAEATGNGERAAAASRTPSVSAPRLDASRPLPIGGRSDSSRSTAKR
jgi:recombination protein RecA